LLYDLPIESHLLDDIFSFSTLRNQQRVRKRSLDDPNDKQRIEMYVRTTDLCCLSHLCRSMSSSNNPHGVTPVAVNDIYLGSSISAAIIGGQVQNVAVINNPSRGKPLFCASHLVG
jgi:hypothetical protein